MSTPVPSALKIEALGLQIGGATILKDVELDVAAGSLVGVFATGFILVAEFPTSPVVITLGLLLIVAGVGLCDVEAVEALDDPQATGEALRHVLVGGVHAVEDFAAEVADAEGGEPLRPHEATKIIGEVLAELD